MLLPQRDSGVDIFNLVLVACFLGGLVLRGLNGWDIPSAWVQLSAFLLILRTPLRQALRAWHLVGLALVLSWLSWRDWSLGYGVSAFADGLKGALILLGLLAVATVPARQTLWPALALVVPVCLVALLAYVGYEELLRALRDPLGVAGSNGLRTPSYRNKLSVALSLACLWAFCLSFSATVWHKVLAWCALVIMASILLVNGGIGTVIAGVTAMAVMLFLLRPHILLHAACIGLIIAIMGLALLWRLRPDFLDPHVLLSGRDWILAATWPHVLEHGLLGAGQGYFAAEVSPTLVMPVSITTGSIMHPHCMYVAYLLAYGLLGMSMLLGFAWMVGRWLDSPMSAIGQALVSGFVVFFLVYGIVDLRPLSPLPFAALLGSGCLLRVLGAGPRLRP